MPDIFSMIFSALQPLLLFFVIPMLPITFLISLGILKLYEPKTEDYKPDPLMMVKAGMYFLQIFMIHLIALGVFSFLDILLSKVTSQSIPLSNIKYVIGTLVGAGAVLVMIELLLVKLDVKKNYLPRRMMYGIAVFLLGFIGTMSTFFFLSGLFEFFPKGAAFHMPLAGMLVYMPLFVFSLFYFKAEFSEEKEVQTFLPASVVQKADQMMAQMPAGFGGAAAAPMAGYGAQPMAGYGAQPMQQQPMQQQPMQQQYSQPMAQPQQQYAQPVAQQPAAAPTAAPTNACPTCGQPGRFIAQYNRNWCDTCQKYL
ncbi:hypothetical protein KKD52_08110 [Myxococcota bacterium]|nr:hypothetical protein [Myxococcota bacterium]MBU1411883.1 hypothetical protein [Myxococcota bacterium]MBU1510312.1 hypothetical protein [Myxococcota bacterium]